MSSQIAFLITFRKSGTKKIILIIDGCNYNNRNNFSIHSKSIATRAQHYNPTNIPRRVTQEDESRFCPLEKYFNPPVDYAMRMLSTRPNHLNKKNVTPLLQLFLKFRLNSQLILPLFREKIWQVCSNGQQNKLHSILFRQLGEVAARANKTARMDAQPPFRRSRFIAKSTSSADTKICSRDYSFYDTFLLK